MHSRGIGKGMRDVGTELLLDTHALLWWATNDRTLSRKVKRLIQDETSKIFVSAASAWEVATKVRLGKLSWTSSESVEMYCLGQRFELMAVTFAHGERAGSWPQAHGDPFDRMLAAQSEIEGLPLATNDPKIELFGVQTVW
jgi:PIN domain nuclease of toxin-antitoxin system